MKKKQRNRLPSLACQNAGDRQQYERGGDIARVKMLVGQVKCGSRNRQRHHRRDKGHACPPRAFLLEENSCNAPGTRDDEENRRELEQQFRGRHGNVGETDKIRNPLIEECRLQLDAEERRIVRIEYWIQVTFDGSQIDAVIFNSRVIAHRRHR